MGDPPAVNRSHSFSEATTMFGMTFHYVKEGQLHYQPTRRAMKVWPFTMHHMDIIWDPSLGLCFHGGWLAANGRPRGGHGGGFGDGNALGEDAALQRISS